MICLFKFAVIQFAVASEQFAVGDDKQKRAFQQEKLFLF
jgi:hypothetical protein